MQITVKFKYRSKIRAVTAQRNSDPAICGSAPLLVPPARVSTGSGAFVSYIDNAHEIISGGNALNHFFDRREKLPAPHSDSSLSSVEAAPEKVEKAFQPQQIPAEEVQVSPGSRIIVHTDPRSPGADRFRFLRMCLRELWKAGKLKTLLITSPLPQDGKSTIALNLATTLAEEGKRSVLLIEADLHRPTLTEQLGLDVREGLADCLEGRLNPFLALRRLEPLNWYLLPAGEPRSNPTELLQTEAFASMLQKLSPLFDWILIDSPPVIPITDALSLARQANATLLVAREGRTPGDAIEKAIAVIGRQRILGIVLNAVEGLDRLYSGYYGYSGYSGNGGAKTIPHVEGSKKSLTRLAIEAKQSVLDPPE
jgi:capsular exopolysaccharide synthesis family protein